MSNDQVTPAETSEILRLAENCLSVPGDFVELGCYRGDTSVLLGKMLQKSTLAHPESSESASPCGNLVENLCKTTKHPVENKCKTPTNPCKISTNLCKTPLNLCKNLWIYDSFEGLPEKTAEDNSGAGQNFQKGELLVSKREVVEKLRKHGLKTASHLNLVVSPAANSASATPPTSLVIVKKAWFDDLQPSDLPAEIAFAFLDGDLYSSIRTSLALVLPRLAARGVIIVHDYNNPELPGSARAVDEFLRAHPQFQLVQKHTLALLRQKC